MSRKQKKMEKLYQLQSITVIIIVKIVHERIFKQVPIFYFVADYYNIAQNTYCIFDLKMMLKTVYICV